MTQIRVPFGSKKYSEMLRSGDAVGFVLDELRKEMKQRGYSSISFGRAVFEDALDWDAKSLVRRMINLRRERNKVPKVLKFDISVGRRE